MVNFWTRSPQLLATMLLTAFGFVPASAQSGAICSDLFSQNALSPYTQPSRELSDALTKQLEAAMRRSRIKMGGINLSREFKRYTSSITVRFPGEPVRVAHIFGRPYQFEGTKVVDFVTDDSSPVLSRVPFATLFEAALNADLKQYVSLNSQMPTRKERRLLFLPREKHGSKKGELEAFQFGRWLDSAKTSIEVTSRSGERRVISLEDFFEGLLYAHQNTIAEVVEFQEAGGRGKVYHSEAGANPAYHGLSILVSAWPKNLKSKKLLFKIPDTQMQIQELLDQKVPVIYSMEVRPYYAVAGHDSPSNKYLTNHIAKEERTARLIFISDFTTPDTIVHERQHLTDFETGYKEQLIEKSSKLSRAYEKEVPNRLRDKDYEQFFHGAVFLVLEQRAYHRQAQYVMDKANRDEIEYFSAKRLVRDLNEELNVHYRVQYQTLADRIRKSGSGAIVDQMNEIIRENIFPSPYITAQVE